MYIALLNQYAWYKMKLQALRLNVVHQKMVSAKTIDLICTVTRAQNFDGY